MTPEQQNETFLDWVQHYDAILWKVARSYASYGEHRDLHQDLLIALWHAVPLYREQSKPSTFIYRIALNGAMNWSRSRNRYRRRHVELEEGAAAAATFDSGEPDQEGRLAHLYRALGALPDADRSLALLYLEELSYREMAEVLGISESNAGVKLHRVKKRLAEQLRQMESRRKEKCDEPRRV